MRCAQINIRCTGDTHRQPCVARGQRVNVAKLMMIAVRQMKYPQRGGNENARKQERE